MGTIVISFLKEENKEEKAGFSDLILFLVIIGLGVGGYFYFSHAETETLESFTEAEELFKSKKYDDAYHAYNALMDASWTTDSLDKVIYRNGQILDIIMFPPENIKPFDSVDTQWKAFALIKAEFKKDTLSYIRTFKKPEATAFLRYDQFHLIELWGAAQKRYQSQLSYFSKGDSLWANNSEQWSQQDSTSFLAAVDTIGKAEYLDKNMIDKIILWKAFKDSLPPE